MSRRHSWLPPATRLLLLLRVKLLLLLVGMLIAGTAALTLAMIAELALII